MKIITINKFFFLKGGSERVFFQEREFLKKQGVKVFDFSMQHPENILSPYSDYFIKNIEYSNSNIKGGLSLHQKIQSGLKLIFNTEANKNLERLIKQVHPDLAHMHNIYHQLTPSIITVLKKAGIKMVMTLHDYKLLCPVYNMINRGRICNKCHGSSFWHTISNRCMDGSLPMSIVLAVEAYWHRWLKSYEKVDMVVSPSNFLADLVKKYRFKRGNITVIPNGIDTNSYRPFWNDKNYIVYFGRISPEKGVETLLNAYDNIGLERRRIGLKIVGQGPQLDVLREKYKYVDFTGYKKDEELKRIVEEASFVVIPSQWYENCSMSVLEAMAMGKPVIASNIGGLPEQVEDGKTGFLFEMGNVEELSQKIITLAKNKELRQTMGRRARQKAINEYSLEVHGRKLLALYEKLMAGEYS